MASRQSIQPRIISHSVDMFAGGMDSDASPYTLQPGQAVLGENVEFYRDNTLRSRKGYALETASIPINGEFSVQRIQGTVKYLYRQGSQYWSRTNEVSAALGSSSGDHRFLRILNGALILEPGRILLVDSDGTQTAGVEVPTKLTGTATTGGKLKEGSYTYTYNYLIKGGGDSPHAEETTVLITAGDSKVTLTIPVPQAHPKLYKLRIFRKDPDGGFPLFIKELDVGTTTYVDTGDTLSALLPAQGVRPMPGGNLGLIHNRRLFVVDQDTLHYSFPGNYGYSNVFWTEKLNLPTGEPITAMCPLGQGVIFFGLESAIYMNSTPSEGGGFNPIPVPDGCVGPSAWTQAEDGTLLYVGKAGVYAMQGANAQRISDPVNDYFEKYTVGQLKNSTLIFDQQERRLLVALPNEILVFHFATKAWAVWTIPNVRLDWFEGRIYMWNNRFGILGEAPNDNGTPITGKFVSGVHGLDDATQFKLFRRMGLQVSAGANDKIDMHIRALLADNSYSGLPDRTIDGATWGVAIWGRDKWGGVSDTEQTVSLPDNIQGRYVQFTITFTANDADSLMIMGPVVFEYRSRYRYGRG